MPKNIVILFSDTGGGHRASSEAIRDALLAQYGAEAQVRMVDALKHYAQPPFNRAPELYPELISHRTLWQWGYDLTDGPRRSRALMSLLWPGTRPGTLKFLRDYGADVYVVIHPAFLMPLDNVRRHPRPPVIAVVTELMCFHALWSHPADLYVTPTEAARQHLISNGVAPDKVRVLGLPVSSRFSEGDGDKARLRTKLGWGSGRPVVLLVGGGEGMGAVADIARAISDSGLECELAVIAGRNQVLRASLEAASWSVPTHIYGFVTEMPDYMRAADVLVTKAGPTTLCEAFSVGLPIVVYDYLPGQEEWNANYVVESGAGRLALGPQAVVEALGELVGPHAHPQALAQAALNARKLARPDAAARIAELIWNI